MFSIVYSSDATESFASIDLAELLAECRAKNRKRGVTGMLLFEDGRFLQALEGPEFMVREVMDLIEHDPRHDHVRILAEEEIDRRRFPDWSMGTGSIDDVEAAPLADYADALVSTRTDPPARTSRRARVADWFRGAP